MIIEFEIIYPFKAFFFEPIFQKLNIKIVKQVAEFEDALIRVEITDDQLKNLLAKFIDAKIYNFSVEKIGIE